MVSKTVLCVFVALCCAQALAFPRDEETLGDLSADMNVRLNPLTCIKGMKQALAVLKDATKIFNEYIQIFAKAQADKEACAAVTGATAASIKKCKEDVNVARRQQLIAEAQKTVDEVLKGLDAINELKHCV